MKKHCKSFFQSSAQNFEPYKSDNAILRYQNQHARQLGLDFSSFTNWKDKNNNSDQSERHKLSSSDKRKHRTDRSDKNVIEPTFPISKRNISIINYNLVGHSTTKIRGQDSQWAPWWAPWWDLMGPLVSLSGPPGIAWAPWQTSGPILSMWSSIGEQCRRASQDACKHPNLGKAPSKTKDYKSKGDK